MLKTRYRWKIFRQVLKSSSVNKLFIGFTVTYFVLCLIIWIIEPGIPTYGDALWYGFVAAATIGFGDFAAMTVAGRILTFILFLYFALILALLTAVFTQYFIELMRVTSKESIGLIRAQLENLPNLSKKELEDLSEEIKKIQK